jgi:hypothetical protein
VLFGGGVVVVAALIGAGAGLWAGRTLPTHTATPQTLRGTVITALSAGRTARVTVRAQGEAAKNRWLDDSRREAYTEL